MKIAIIGTGMVGQTIAAKLVSLGHPVVIGTRDVAQTLGRTSLDGMGNPPYSVWAASHPEARLVPISEAAAWGELVINATSGQGSLAALTLAGEALSGKILVDIANPLDFSKGMPPSLFVCNTDSLGEQIQKAFPKAKVVKTLNIVTAPVMVNPASVAGGDHTMFVAGNDRGSKEQVTEILKKWFGWKDVIDLGDITHARGTEMLLPIWIRTWGALGTPMFGFKIAR